MCSSLTTVVIREGWDTKVPPNSPDLDPGCLHSLSDTCGGLWMSLRWDWGTRMIMNTQSFISHPWHQSHSDTDTHWDTKPQLPRVPDWHTTLGTNATQLHLAVQETPHHSSRSASLYIPLHGCMHNGQKWIHLVFKGEYANLDVLKELNTSLSTSVIRFVVIFF